MSTKREAQRLIPCTDGDPEEQEKGDPPEHEKDHSHGVSAERHPHPDLDAAPAHSVGRDAVEADTREEQGEDAEEAREQGHDHALS